MTGWDVWKKDLEADQGKMVSQRPGSPPADNTRSKPIGLWKLQVDSANAAGDSQKKSSLSRAAEVSYYQLGKVTKDFILPSE